MKERMQKFLDTKKISALQFQKKCGLPNGFVNNIGDSIRKVTQTKILNAFPELNINWLLTGDGEMLRSNLTTGENDNNNSTPTSISMGKVIPFYDAEAAAGGDYAVSVEPISKPIGMIEIGGVLRDSESALRVYGNSMTPNYPSGCIVGLKPHYDHFIEPGNVYVVETRDNRYLKRLYYNDDKTGYQCISDNHMLHDSGPRIGKPYYPEFDIPFEDIVRLFRVVGVIKRNIL